MASKPKREAKAVEHFAPEEIKEKAELVIGEGAGTKLGDIENVKLKIDKLQATMSALEGKLDRVLGGKGV